MKFFTRQLAIALCIMGAIAQMSDRCIDAINEYQNGTQVRTVDKCKTLNTSDLCSRSECFIVDLPSELNTVCSSNEEKEAVENLKKAYEQLISIHKLLCGGKTPSGSGSASSGNDSKKTTTVTQTKTQTVTASKKPESTSTATDNANENQDISLVPGNGEIGLPKFNVTGIDDPTATTNSTIGQETNNIAQADVSSSANSLSYSLMVLCVIAFNLFFM